MAKNRTVWVTLPDGSRVTREEGFQAWLAKTEAQMDLEFLNDDLTDLPDDPYNAAGLDMVEQHLIKNYPDSDDILADRDMMDQYVRFVGECFVRGLGYSWTCLPGYQSRGPIEFAVEREDIDSYLEVPRLVTMAAHRQTGEEWSYVYGYSVEDIEKLATLDNTISQASPLD